MMQPAVMLVSRIARPPMVPNLLAGASWVAGPNTNLQDMGNGRMRVQRSGGNPSAYKQVTLIPGATYRLNGTVWNNPSFGSYTIEVAENSALNLNYSYDGPTQTTDNFTLDTTFVAANTGTWFAGIRYFTGANDTRFCEIEKAFRLQLVSLP